MQGDGHALRSYPTPLPHAPSRGMLRDQDAAQSLPMALIEHRMVVQEDVDMIVEVERLAFSVSNRIPNVQDSRELFGIGNIRSREVIDDPIVVIIFFYHVRKVSDIFFA